jgi:hypothetical protein
MKLDIFDLKFAINRLPLSLRKIMEDNEWVNRIFIGGGYLRSIVAGEKVNDIDVFCNSKADAELIAYKLCKDKKDIYKTDNAYTVKDRLTVQVIHRWLFEKPESVSDSFDFTICCAVIFYNGKWDSYCDERFYMDLASRRIVYRSPIRNEDAGGSMLRVLKYYQKGYRIPLDSLGGVISRLVRAIDVDRLRGYNEAELTRVLTGLLREVDPDIDPLHLSHLPSMVDEDVIELPEDKGKEDNK